ncbi:unnamed protein product [Eruca vesicaria subsp. sativa]|uniref:RRM domain-containing protein n=1 Tax=Eruca vesicaria subsp. sativa TaxID=29727 RepID=A0ABC8KPQ4_ERUVS|nr:unnamed protein product [Eruca vesicaria subsp. sativa]
MGKKSATKVEAAPAAIKATKPLKKGKRDPEDDLDTKVNLKKQKNDVIAAVQKEKAEKKVPKKVENSDSSDIEEEEEVAATAVAKNGSVKAKADSSSEEDSSDESKVESEDEKKPAAKKTASATTKAASKSDSSEEDSDEESVDEKPAAKKDSSSDDSESDESESEDEKETPKEKNSDAAMVDDEQKQPKTPSTPPAGGSKTLFVANLSFDVERSDVENFFKGVGEVVDVRFAMSKDDGSFRGFGHVEFATAEQAQKALELHGTSMLGRDIRLDVAQERGERPAYTPQSCAGGNFRSGGGGGQSIFVKGFDSSLPEEDIKSALSAHFASCGEITRVSVPCDRDTGASKGIAYLDFKEGADKAFDLNGSEMGGWSLVVDQPREKSSGGFGGGGRSGGRGRDGGRFSSGGRRSGGGRGRDSGRGRFGSGRGGGRGREGGGRGFSRSSFTTSGKKTTFNDE